MLTAPCFYFNDRLDTVGVNGRSLELALGKSGLHSGLNNVKQ
jgi:hypothetical protein